MKVGSSGFWLWVFSLGWARAKLTRRELINRSTKAMFLWSLIFLQSWWPLLCDMSHGLQSFESWKERLSIFDLWIQMLNSQDWPKVHSLGAANRLAGGAFPKPPEVRSFGLEWGASDNPRPPTCCAFFLNLCVHDWWLAWATHAWLFVEVRWRHWAWLVYLHPGLDACKGCVGWSINWFVGLIQFLVSCLSSVLGR